MSFWYFYCQLWTYFTPFPSVSIFEFEQVNGNMGMACFIQCYQILRLLLLERILGADEIFRLTQPELSCLSKWICLLHKQIQYVFCSFWLYKFLDLLTGLARFMKVSWFSKHIDFWPWNCSSQEAGQVFYLCPSSM